MHYIDQMCVLFNSLFNKEFWK